MADTIKPPPSSSPGSSPSSPTTTLAASSRIRLHRDRFPGRPAYDTAVSHAMLRRVAAGASPESLRLYQPENVVLFSSLDARRPGFARAVEIATEAGFGTAMRLAGGHVAAFLDQSMAFAWATRQEAARLHIRPRFQQLANLIVEALSRLGLDARIGEVPGEYCPGEYSVNIEGRVKVMGVGQRVIRDGAHVGGVLTIAQTGPLRNLLIPIHEALELDFRPETAGGIADFDPSIGVEDVIAAIKDVLLDQGVQLEATRLDDATLVAAEDLVAMHETNSMIERDDRSRHDSSGKTLLDSDPHALREDPDRHDGN